MRRQWNDKIKHILEGTSPFVALLAALTFTALFTILAFNKVRSDNLMHFDLTSRQITTMVQNRMHSYRSALIHTRSLFISSQEVTRTEFATYIDAIDLATEYPGVLGIGFAQRIPANQLAAHERKVQQSGFPGYHVWPEGPRDEYFSIVYIEPFNPTNQRAFGYDMFTEPVRREAMARARDSGQPAVSGRVMLVQEADPERGIGFLIYVPYYRPGADISTVEARRKALVGFIYSPFRAHDVFEGIDRKVNDRESSFNLEIYAAPIPSISSVLYDNDGILSGIGAKSTALMSINQIPVIGTNWTIVVSAEPGFLLTGTTRAPLYIFISGLLISALVFRMSFSYHQYSQAIRTSEDQLRLVIDSLPALISYINPKEIISFCNRYYSKIFGHPDATGFNLREVLGKTTYERRQSFIKRALQGERLTFEDQMNVQGNEQLTFSLEYVPDIREDGTVAGFVALGTDITEQKEIQAQLVELATSRLILAEIGKILSSSLEYERTLETVAKLMVPRLADGCAISINERDHLHRIFSSFAFNIESDVFSPQAYPQKVRDWIFRSVESGHIFFHPAMQPMDPAEPCEIEFLNILKQKGVVSNISVPIETRTNHYGALSFVIMKSGRSFSASDLDFAREIASRIASAIENSKLYKEAQSLNRAKDEFLATLSHELRTPLNVIQGHAELLRSEPTGNTEIDDSIEAIHRNARIQTQIINDLLDVSSIITGKVSFEPIPIEINQLVRDAIDGVKLSAESKGILLKVATTIQPLYILGDSTRLQQILWNLLSNALKFTSSGGSIAVTIEAKNDRAVIRVHDTGRGIDPDFLPFVFDRFRQEDNTMTRRFGGLGLGLSIVRNLVDLHDGTVRAESEGVGKGSEFILSFPIAFVTSGDKPPS